MNSLKMLQPVFAVLCITLSMGLSQAAWAADNTLYLVHDVDRGNIPKEAKVRLTYTWEAVQQDGFNYKHGIKLYIAPNKQSINPQLRQPAYYSYVTGQVLPNTFYWSAPFVPGTTNKKIKVEWTDDGGQTWSAGSHTETKTEISEDGRTKRVYIKLSK
ncbi:hypothetical protein POL68_32765 [Stigmatella sp. ncwal1]|uniref:Uncharacterized protein n=1 Tax=Stigmatella ashevillensis TaxID=2995309 RepID=A0ABT5DLP6_9BACT|nr:hypothetical protein [Stigmatella ashevillena]MDC0713281.1 hypothetical protein [Stigmatella ashevillena]